MLSMMMSMLEKLRKWRKGLLNRDSFINIPVLICFIIFVNVIFYSMATSVVFSFLPRMVKYFGFSELKTGTYAGILASSIYLGRLFFSVLWGYLTDTFGKKNTAILTGVMLFASTMAFGFSQNYYWAVITRFLQGCSQGQIIVSKSILADVCDDDNMAFGLSVVMTSYTVGEIAGPSMGGFLVFPNEAYPQTFSKDNVFSRYAILLPNFIICLGLALGILLTMKFIPQDKAKSSNKKKLLSTHNRGYGTIQEDPGENNKYKENKVTVSICDSQETKRKSDENNKYIENKVTVSICDSQETKRKSDENNKYIENKVTVSICDSQETKSNSKFLMALSSKECILSGLLYGLFSLVDMGINEMFPILAATIPKYKGMGFSTSDIGMVLMVVSIFLAILQLTVLPKLNKYFGSKKVLITSNLILVFFCPMLPVLAAIRNRIALWVSILLFILIVRTCVFTAYLCINVFVNNSVQPELLGSANGIALSFASVGRLIGPLICGSLYSWSLTNIKGVDDGNQTPLGFPFNQFFVFFIISIWAIMVALITTFVPDSMNFKKVKTVCKPPSFTE